MRLIAEVLFYNYQVFARQSGQRETHSGDQNALWALILMFWRLFCIQSNILTTWKGSYISTFHCKYSQHANKGLDEFCTLSFMPKFILDQFLINFLCKINFSKKSFFQFFEKILENFLENLKNHESHLKCSRIRSKMFFDIRERAFNSWGVVLQLTRVCKTKWTEKNSLRRPECSMSSDFDVLDVVLYPIEHAHHLNGLMSVHFSL